MTQFTKLSMKNRNSNRFIGVSAQEESEKRHKINLRWAFDRVHQNRNYKLTQFHFVLHSCASLTWKISIPFFTCSWPIFYSAERFNVFLSHLIGFVDLFLESCKCHFALSLFSLFYFAKSLVTLLFYRLTANDEKLRDEILSQRNTDDVCGRRGKKEIRSWKNQKLQNQKKN